MPNYEIQEISQQWWVIGNGNKFGPFTKARAEEIAALLNSKGLVIGGCYSGKILETDGGLIWQRIGRNNEFVLHAAINLPASVKTGDVIDIRYQNGIGTTVRKQAIER